MKMTIKIGKKFKFSFSIEKAVVLALLMMFPNARSLKRLTQFGALFLLYRSS